ncbi:MAG: acetylxylan esterase [Oceanipulchritudo sp.]
MTPEANYVEACVPDYALPDPLTREDGSGISTAEEWPGRRSELLQLFARHQYGYCPARRVHVGGRVLSGQPETLDGRARMKQVEVNLHRSGKSLALGLLLFLPETPSTPVPVFLGLNFYGNHTVHPDPRIRLHRNWSPDSGELRVTGNRACAASRGLRAHRWPVEEIIGRGYALATVYCGDIDPDFDDGFHNGVHGLFDERDFTAPAEERWGTIAAWAWGLSRILDYIIKDEPDIDSSRVIAIGHSRMGKAALWAAANDERFAAVISNESGCAGAALHRRRFGERLVHLNSTFPHWLNQRAKDYNEREDALPFDQHQLLALIAPRPVYIASAAEDLWADPRGEFLSLIHAEPVYQLLDAGRMESHAMPQPGGALMERLSYHIRPGIHDLLPEDWRRFLDFAGREVR